MICATFYTSIIVQSKTLNTYTCNRYAALDGKRR
jgi:hypothetical protein